MRLGEVRFGGEGGVEVQSSCGGFIFENKVVGEAGVGFGVGGVETNQVLVMEFGTAHDVKVVILGKLFAVRGGVGESLKPNFAHFVGGLESPADAARRIAGVEGVVGGIVVGVVHDDACADGKLQRSGVLVIALPVEIPMLDPEEPLLSAIGQEGAGSHFFGEIMGMR